MSIRKQIVELAEAAEGGGGNDAIGASMQAVHDQVCAAIGTARSDGLSALEAFVLLADFVLADAGSEFIESMLEGDDPAAARALRGRFFRMVRAVTGITLSIRRTGAVPS